VANGDEDPGAATRPGPFLFDPVLGAALFNEIQAEGLRAAGALVERLVHLVDGSQATTVSDAADRTDESPAEAAGSEMRAILPWFELWRDLVERTADTAQRFQGAGAGTAREGVQVGIDGSLAPVHPLVIAVDSGGRGQGEMWLHNGTASDHGELIPHCGPLSDEYGVALGYDAEIEPPKIDGLPSRSSRGFVISLRTDLESSPGTYRGIVQVRGAGAVWMPLEVVVPARSS
jgi:hypothetical protein